MDDTRVLENGYLELMQFEKNFHEPVVDDFSLVRRDILISDGNYSGDCACLDIRWRKEI